MERYFYNLTSGVDVYESLNELYIQHGSKLFLLSAVGDLSKVSFKCPLNEKPIIIQNKLEIITLSGYLKESFSHLHISVSDNNCSVFRGHLLPGSIVLKSVDVLVGVIPNLNQQSISNVNINSPVVDIYVLSDCPWAKRALKLLDSYNIKYNSFLVTNDDQFRTINDKTSIDTFPQIFINNEFIGGYTELVELYVNNDLFRLVD